MDEKLLGAFCAVAELGNVTHAAAVLGEEQSALSRRINALETRLAGRLFLRTGRGVVLTDLGERLYPRAKLILGELAELEKEAHSIGRTVAGTVEIGAAAGLARSLITECLVAIQREYPDIKIRAREGFSGHIESWLANGHIDVGVFNRYGRGTVKDAELILRSEVVLVSARADFPQLKDVVPLKVLDGLPLVLPLRPNGLFNRATDLASEHGFPLNVKFEVTTGALMHDAVARASLCTLIPQHVAHRDYGDAAFTISRIERKPLQQSSWLALSVHHPATEATRVVARELRRIADTIH